jgi:long-subunit fatty acid transport protein
MTKHGLILILLLCVTASPAVAGETEYPLFKMGAGGRAVAMGGAFTGVADDATAVFWNPAGMAQIKSRFSLAFTNRLHFQDSKFLEFFATYSDIKYGAFGIGVLSDQIDEILGYDSGFNYLGKFGAYQRSIMVGYAYNLTPVYVGLSLGTVLAGMDPPQGKLSGNGLTVALGLMTRITKNFRIGSTIRPGFSVKYDNTKDETPGNARLGAELALRTGISSPTDSLRFAIDLDQTNKLPMKINAGLELTFFKLLAIRGGLNSLNFETRTSELTTSDLMSSNLKYCFGAGIRVPSSSIGALDLDFGYMSTRVGNSTAITISWAK